jgi:hypothetical protein
MKRVRRLLPALFCGAVLIATGCGSDEADEGPDEPAFYPFTIDPTGGCVARTEPSGSITGQCDPINVIFIGRTWPEVRDLLIERGWTTSGLGGVQQLEMRSAGESAPQDTQLFLVDALGRRYHVRLWQLPDAKPPITLAGVHHERGLFTHDIDMAWEDAEAFLAAQFCAASCEQTPLPEQSSVQASGPDGDAGKWRGWANNASATVIR